MQAPPDDRAVGANVAHNEPTGIVLLHRVEKLTGEFDVKAGHWHTEVRYEVPELLHLPGGSSQATIAEPVAELVAGSPRRARRSGVDGGYFGLWPAVPVGLAPICR